MLLGYIDVLMFRVLVKIISGCFWVILMFRVLVKIISELVKIISECFGLY